MWFTGLAPFFILLSWLLPFPSYKYLFSPFNSSGISYLVLPEITSDIVNVPFCNIYIFLFSFNVGMWHFSASLRGLRFYEKQKIVAIYKARGVSGLFVNTHLQKFILAREFFWKHPLQTLCETDPEVLWISINSVTELGPPGGLSLADFCSS